MISDLRHIIEEGPIGVGSIEKFVQAGLKGAESGGPDAVGLFVFAKLAEPFSDYYADQALGEAEATGFRDRLVASLLAYEAAATADARVAALANAISGFMGATTK